MIRKWRSWLAKGQKLLWKPEILGFGEEIALPPGPPKVSRMRSRRMARLREHKAESKELQKEFVNEVMRCVRDGRIPLDVALKGLEMCLDEVRDRLAEESLSWLDDPRTKWHPGDRGVSGE